VDIVLKEKKQNLLQRYRWWIFGSAASIALAIVVVRFAKVDSVAKRDRVSVASVQRGEFLVQVRGVGVLTPKYTQFLGANVEGRVERIDAEAGAEVKKGDILARIVNPKLPEQLSEARWEMEALKKEYVASEAMARAELANLRAEAKNAQLNYEAAKLKRDAEALLLDRGIVSKLNYEQSRLSVEQLIQRIQAADERVAMQEAKLRAEIEAHVARLRKIHNTINLIQQQVDDLLVKAPINGVVQQMALKLGQQVIKGTEVGRIAPHDNMVAMLDIQDYLVRDVRVGQAVKIDTHGTILEGRVARIDPGVSKGVVKVEVTLLGETSSEIRLDQSVEGLIDIARKNDTVFVKRPQLAQSHGKSFIYRLEGDTAIRTLVDFGLVSTRDIEVLNGLNAGDQIVVSDVSSWGGHERVLLN